MNWSDSNTFIQIGCDYQHYGDEDWQGSNHGALILRTDGKEIYEKFLALVGHK